MKIISWNVNGIRSNIVDTTTAKNKSERILETTSPLGIIIERYNPDIVCFQETRLGPDNYSLFESSSIKEAFPFQYWSSASKEGARSGNRYSGTSIWSKIPALHATYELEGLDNKEGRVIQLEFGECILINTYVPNAGSNWEYRLNTWDPAINHHIKNLNIDKPDKTVIYCGDNNIANKNDVWFGDILDKCLELEKNKTPIDNECLKTLTKLVKSKQRYHSGKVILCGYSKPEQANFKQLLEECELVDSYRYLYPTKIDKFSWFNARVPNCLQTNKGWLIDRFLVSQKDQKKIEASDILYEIGTHRDKKLISDHLPILLRIK